MIPIILRTYVQPGFQEQINALVQDAAGDFTDYRHYFIDSKIYKCEILVVVTLLKCHIGQIQADLSYYGLLAGLEFKSLNRP